MLKEDILLQIFNEETSGKNQLKGQRVYNNDLISSLDITNEDNLICITSNVISENLFNEYNAKIELDADKKSIFSTYCSCADYEKNEFNKRNYCCKHLVATFYKAVGDLAKHPLLNEENYDDKKVHRSNLLATLLGDENNKEQIKIEIYIDKNEWNNKLMAEFKIGLSTTSSSNLYVLKDINQFLVGMYNNVPINYGKNFTFDVRVQSLNTKDKRLIDFIETLREIEKNQNYVNRNGHKIIDGKYINIPNYLVREFFQVVRKHRVYLNEGFFCRNFETEILFDSPAVEFDLKLIKDEYVLKSPGGMPEVLGSKNDVFLYGTTIYLPDYEFCYKISPYLRVFNESKVVVIPNSEEKTVLKRLVPDLNGLTPNITLSKTIKDRIVMEECKFNFYFDKEEGKITLTVKVQYGAYEFNIFEDCKEKVIYRDSKKETEVKTTIRTLGFEEIEGRYYLMMGEEYTFRFFKNEMLKFQELGEVYYSENFRGIKHIGTKSITGDIKAGKYNYFELDFTIAGISPQETAHILRAFRDNLKYYKLKDGEYLDLEQLELKRFLKLLDMVSSKNIDNNHIEISKNKAAFIADYLEESNIRYIKGKKELKEIRDKLKNIKKLKFEVPVDLKGNLREYQKLGFNWFKTLDYLGFGGILGDEMGLGKTLQTIAFILSNKSSKSLIVAPTSLIYNWLSEFGKFAPSVKIKVVNGLREEREETIKSLENYDVIITTYNLLKRDLESYRNIEFDYCILDEAQNIKNYNSQNAIAVKEVKARNRFALSGTPIENSLMELWSIFDFIMPGYLYDEKRFSVRYHKKLRESPEVLEDLNRLIKPFILRRKKREVIKELPDKIEKALVVELEDEQKKVYKAYANYALELIQKKVKDYEFQNSKIEILSYITKLRQICLDPSILMEDYSGSSGKIEALIELLHKIIEEGHKVLVFSQFTSVLKNIGKKISADGISFSYLDGSMTSEKRMETVKNFNDGGNPVFLISLKAGGTGLNLTSADVVIHFDPWWNPAVEEQATDRAHRIGQKNVVQVIKIIAKGTIEEKIISLQEQKKKLISQLMGDSFSKGSELADLSDEQILELFRV